MFLFGKKEFPALACMRTTSHIRSYGFLCLLLWAHGPVFSGDEATFPSGEPQSLNTVLPWDSSMLVGKYPSGDFVVGSPKAGKIWSVSSDGKVMNSLVTEQGLSLESLKLLADGRLILFQRSSIGTSVRLTYNKALENTGSIVWAFEPDKASHHMLSFSPDGTHFLSHQYGSYMADAPERLVGHGLFSKDNRLLQSFSTHMEGGRLYSDLTAEDIIDFIKERMRGFYQPQAVIAFDHQGDVLVADSHGRSAVARFYTTSGERQELFQPKTSSHSPRAQRAPVALELLAKTTTVVPIDRLKQLAISNEKLIAEVESDPNLETEQIRIWGILPFENGDIGLIERFDLRTGEQECRVYSQQGEEKGVWALPKWSFLSPGRMTKMVMDKRNATTLQMTAKGNCKIVSYRAQ